MELLIARDLNIERGGRTLLGGVGLVVRSGMRVGVTGPNGSGKSTLLETLAGKRTPSSGYLRTAPGIRVGHLSQQREIQDRRSAWEFALQSLDRIRELERQLRREERLLADGVGSLEQYGELLELFENLQGYAAEARLRESLTSLGFADGRLEVPVADLSGGERARLALARALAEEPELLLLDEPSNHLDLPALRWLGARLAQWRGGLLLVSHDRALLDEVTTHTAAVKEGSLRIERGNYSRYRQRQGNQLLHSERKRRERIKRAERLERTAAELRSWGNRGAQRRRRRIERELEEARAAPAGRVAGSSEGSEGVVLLAREAQGLLLEARGLRRDLDGTRLSVPYLRLDAGEKVALLGANGSGKSTLLNLLAGELASDDPRARIWRSGNSKLFHAGQDERGLSDDSTLGDQLNSLVRRERASMLLALCGLPTSSLERYPTELSGGERARAGLALMLASEANLLLLDEPGNDLDLAAIETLQHAIEHSDAAVVLATHDRVLASLANEVWAIEEGRLVEYRGGVDGYLAGRRRLEPTVGREPEGSFAGAATAARGRSGAPSPGDDQGEEPVEEVTGNVPAHDEKARYSELIELPAVERLELERMGIEERLYDPLLLSEREVERLRARLAATVDELSSIYDAALPAPRPSFSLRESGIRVWANSTQDGLELGCEAAVSLRLVLHGDVAHLMLQEQNQSCLLGWARSALVDGAIRIVFYTLSPRVVQHHHRGSLHSRLLTRSGEGWWSVDRHEFESIEGWTGSGRIPAQTRTPAEPGRVP